MADQSTHENARCNCESSLCDHKSACVRSASGRFLMDYVGRVCETCAKHACISGGAGFISLDTVVPAERDPMADQTLAIQHNLGALDHSTFAALANDCGNEGEGLAQTILDSAVSTLPRAASVVDYLTSDNDRTYVVVKFHAGTGRDAGTYATYLLVFNRGGQFPSEQSGFENGHYGLTSLREAAEDLEARVGTPRLKNVTSGTPDTWADQHYSDDSPFGEICRDADRNRLEAYSFEALDEALSVASSLLSVPRYESSPTLARIQSRIADERNAR